MSDNESTGNSGLSAPESTPVVETTPAPATIAEAMYPEEDDHRKYVVDLELDFFHGTIEVKDGIVIRAPQMLKWTQEYPDGNERQTPFADVLEWYKRPNKTDKEGNPKAPEYKNARVIRVLG